MENKLTHDYEPLRRNRFIVTFTEGIQVEPWRVVGVTRHVGKNLSSDYKYRSYTFKILETVAHNSFVDKEVIGTTVAFKIEYLDPTGVVVKTDAARGQLFNQNMTDLDMEDDNLIYSIFDVSIDND